jgi:hypothetical protein
VALFPGAGGALYEPLAQIDVPDDGPGGGVAARLVPVDALDDVADPPADFAVTLIAGPGLAILAPDLDGDPTTEVVPIASASGVDVLVGDAGGANDSGVGSTLAVVHDGYPVEVLAVQFTPAGSGTTTTSTTTALTTTTTSTSLTTVTTVVTTTTTTSTTTAACATDITFAAIGCRFDALLNDVDVSVSAGPLHDAVVTKMRTARPLLDQAETLDRKRARALLKKVASAARFVESHLRARKAVALVPDGVRPTLIAAADALGADVRALRATL